MAGIGSFVVYGASGVCRIEDLRSEKLGDVIKDYYILKPMRNMSSTIFVPADAEALVMQMMPVLSPEELHLLFEQARELPEEEWITDARKRSEYLKSIFSDGKRLKILACIKTLRRQKKRLEERGKHLCSSDDVVLQKAEDIFINEICISLDFTYEQAQSFFESQID